MHPVLSEWSDYTIAVGLSPNTARTRVKAVAAIANAAGVDPLQLERRHVLAAFRRLEKQWTRCTYWASLRAFELWANEFDYGPIELTRGIPKPKTPPPVARPVDDHVVQALLAATLPRRSRAYVLLALFQGLRVHEIAKIAAEDLDLTTRWMLVTGKGGSTEQIRIHPRIVELAEDMPEFGYWFPSHTALGHVRPLAVSETLKNVLRSVGSPATAHQLRDTFASRFQRQQKDIRVTQRATRHKALQSVMKYTAVTDDTLAEAWDALSWDDVAA